MNAHYDRSEDVLEVNYPALYQAANAASVRAQRWHFACVFVYLGLLVVAALFSTMGLHSRSSAVVAACFFLATIFTAVFMRYRRYDRNWYKGRALAESVKTLSWRYMMRSEPYGDTDDARLVRRDFGNALSEILSKNAYLGHLLGGEVASSPQITDAMNLVRSRPIGERKEIYRRCRIDEQRLWYAKKSGMNARANTHWFCFMISLQALALLCVLIQIAWTDLTWLPTEALAVCAASVMAWTQAKKYEELSAAYSLTAHEIGFVRGGLDSIPDFEGDTDQERRENEKKFSDFVQDAENAFSREHTQWFARRDNN